MNSNSPLMEPPFFSNVALCCSSCCCGGGAGSGSASGVGMNFPLLDCFGLRPKCLSAALLPQCCCHCRCCSHWPFPDPHGKSLQRQQSSQIHGTKDTATPLLQRAFAALLCLGFAFNSCCCSLLPPPPPSSPLLPPPALLPAPPTLPNPRTAP